MTDQETPFEKLTLKGMALRLLEEWDADEHRILGEFAGSEWADEAVKLTREVDDRRAAIEGHPDRLAQACGFLREMIDQHECPECGALDNHMHLNEEYEGCEVRELLEGL